MLDVGSAVIVDSSIVLHTSFTKRMKIAAVKKNVFHIAVLVQVRHVEIEHCGGVAVVGLTSIANETGTLARS